VVPAAHKPLFEPGSFHRHKKTLHLAAFFMRIN
jgi:hypothetical protein